jgi:hypothetical protein
MKMFKRTTEQKTDGELSEFLKHAPHRPGGLNYKVRVDSCYRFTVGCTV